MPRSALTALERLDAAWFTPMPAARLAVVRVLVGAYALVRVSVLFGPVLQRAARGSAFVRPVGPMSLLPHAPPVPALAVVVCVAAASGIAFVAGLHYRWTAPLFAASLLAVVSYFNSFGMLYHSDQLLVLHACVLALAPAADTLSLDALRRERAGLPPPAEPHFRYGWPIRLLCALIVVMYLLSGVAKVAAHGWEWALADGVRAQIGKDALRKQLLGEDGGVLGRWVLRNAWVATSIGVGTLAVELGAPLALLGRRAGRTWALGALAMHWGVFAIMGIAFRYQLLGVAFLPFFPAEQLALGLRRARLVTATSSR